LAKHGRGAAGIRGGNADAVVIEDGEIDLRPGVALPRGALVPGYRLGVVALDPQAVGVGPAQRLLGVGVAVLGGIGPGFDGVAVAPAVVGLQTLAKAVVAAGAPRDRDEGCQDRRQTTPPRSYTNLRGY
jgi:hypothetical protein